MADLNKKVIWNAVSAYFLFFVSISFLFNKDPNIWHPFVKSHVRVAFFLHILFLCMLILMAFPIGNGIAFFGYTLNSIVTIAASIIIFSAIFFGIYKAHKWETLSISELFEHGKKWSSEIMQQSSTKNIWEEEKTLLFLSHLPFIGYIVTGERIESTKIRNIILLNIIISCTGVFLYTVWISSLASIIFLLYIIWSIFQGIRIFAGENMILLNLHNIPTIREKYILQKSFLTQLVRHLFRRKFISLSDIKKGKTEKLLDTEKAYKENLSKLSPSLIPTFLFYIPVINIIWIFFLRTQQKLHIKNGLIISMIFWVIVFFYWIHHPMLYLLLFPICFWIGQRDNIAYIMPYIYDIWNFISLTLYKTTHIFSRAKELKNTTKKEVMKMNEAKKES